MTREALDSLEGRNLTPELSQKAIQTTVDIQSKPLSEKDAKNMKQEADLMKSQIAEIKKNTGAKVVLFDIPIESRVNATLRMKQVRELAKKLFPPGRFEWLPPPKEREWRTNDGIHLICSDARDFAEFLRDNTLLDLRLKNSIIGNDLFHMGLEHGPTVAFFFWIGINSWARVAAAFLGSAPTKESL